MEATLFSIGDDAGGAREVGGEGSPPAPPPKRTYFFRTLGQLVLAREMKPGMLCSHRDWISAL